MLLQVVKLAELVQYRCRKLHVVTLEPLSEQLLALFLDFPVIPAEDGLYLAFGFGGVYKVDP